MTVAPNCSLPCLCIPACTTVAEQGCAFTFTSRANAHLIFVYVSTLTKCKATTLTALTTCALSSITLDHFGIEICWSCLGKIDTQYLKWLSMCAFTGVQTSWAKDGCQVWARHSSLRVAIYDYTLRHFCHFYTSHVHALFLPIIVYKVYWTLYTVSSQLNYAVVVLR